MASVRAVTVLRDAGGVDNRCLCSHAFRLLHRLILLLLCVAVYHCVVVVLGRSAGGVLARLEGSTAWTFEGLVH